MPDVRELIATLERLDREATPGPWHAEQDGERAYLTRGPIKYEGEHIKRADWLADFEREDGEYEDENVTNALTAATLRNALPRIIALLKAGDELWNNAEEYCHCAAAATVDGIDLAPVVCDRHRAIADWYRAARG